jgi:hypothetical protein
MNDKDANPTETTTPPATASTRNTEGRRKKKGDQAGSFTFALGSNEDPGANGLPMLTATFADESDAVDEAYRKSVPYYKLQKFVATKEKTPDGKITISGVPS